MRYAGIDVGSQSHVVALVGPDGELLVMPSAFAENAAGYQKLLGLLGPPSELVVALERTSDGVTFADTKALGEDFGTTLPVMKVILNHPASPMESFAYEQLKDLTRGERIGPERLREFIRGLDLPQNAIDRLLALTPATYTGAAEQLARHLTGSRPNE